MVETETETETSWTPGSASTVKTKKTMKLIGVRVLS